MRGIVEGRKDNGGGGEEGREGLLRGERMMKGGEIGKRGEKG